MVGVGEVVCAWVSSVPSSLVVVFGVRGCGVRVVVVGVGRMWVLVWLASDLPLLGCRGFGMPWGV